MENLQTRAYQDEFKKERKQDKLRMEIEAVKVFNAKKRTIKKLWILSILKNQET